MSGIALSVRKIAKEYRIGERLIYRTMREHISNLALNNYRRMISTLTGRETACKDINTNELAYKSTGFTNYQQIGTTDSSKNKNEHIKSSNYFWSLKNISFDVRIGEIIGIIGLNGAGKSTLLKIISGITEPTEGRIDLYGRIASLLEVGTGFHQELTGRENIYLNGAILGMRKKEIDHKFDEIVDFSGCQQFIDTPVKFYSSGMRVRLGFSVAAHLEPEMLIIDEVLAVGDVAFQKKCLGKLNNVSTSEGRTVLFVSHDMTAIMSLCQRTILLESGQLIADGPTDEVVQQYIQSTSSTNEIPLDQRTDRKGNFSVLITSLKIENSEGGKPIYPSSKIKIKIAYRSKGHVRNPRFIIRIRDFRTHTKMLLIDSDMMHGLPDTLPPVGYITCVTDEIYLTPGRCSVDVEVWKETLTADYIEHAAYFDIEPEDVYGSGKIPTRDQATALLKYKWSLDND